MNKRTSTNGAKTYPKESDEQEALFQWAELQAAKYPELKLMYHIPNGGKRYIGEAVKLKAQGVKSGVPDVFLPVAKKTYHGLYIELKRQKNGHVSDSQEKWIEALNDQGYMAVVCYGCQEAIETILQYLKG